ncbi:unnamed protein product [Paramecium pentaurelia]|uniref:Uncharacterized protein n=1 Tax=Paramecium pentaurelia TaxID=43138 RepID=A0A8S1Y4G6_9CILI|nr:unnamed protein product [Paramecium pentaurelia]
MYKSITVQTLPPEQIRQFQVLLTFQYVNNLLDKCAEFLQYKVQLFQDKECKYEIDSQLSIEQAKLNNIIFAKRIQSESASSYYPKVICWFKQNGVELSLGVMLSSDFTFEEVLHQAKQKNIIQSIPKSIQVTDLNQTKILATLMEMQMCKLIDPKEIDPQLLIQFDTINFASQISNQSKLIPQFQFQQYQAQPKTNQIASSNVNPQSQNQAQPKTNQIALSNVNPQPQQFKIQNFSIQANPLQFMQKQQINKFQPISNFDNQLNQQNSRIQPNSLNLGYSKNIITNPFIPNSNGNLQNFNQIQPQQQLQINNQLHFKGNETIQQLENTAIQSVEQMITIGKFNFQINQQGDFVVYQCSSPEISGYFLQVKGKKGTLKDEKQFKWENKFGVQIADNLGKGFIIKWKNNTYNSLITYFQ